MSDLGHGESPWHDGCVDGAVEACSIELGKHDGIISCYEGTRSCKAGSFGPCTDGRSFDVAPARESASIAPLRPLAFSAPSDCLNNPCNRYCREFNEAPPMGLSADVDGTAPPLSNWPTGNLGDYPPETVVVGNQEPCETAGDCQFNTACHDPALGSCGHSVCATSEPLVPGCNRCADTVCAIDPTCCDVPSACVHDPCEVGSGTALDPSCDSCVNAVCAAHPSCCGVTWDAACVGFIATECAPLGQSCGCPDGSVAEDGSCHILGETPLDFGQSRDACGTFGLDWSLITVNDAAENARAQGLLSAGGLNAAWLGGTETTTDQWTWVGTGEAFFANDSSGGSLLPGYTYQNFEAGQPDLGLPAQSIVMAGTGQWRNQLLTDQLPYLCEGSPNRISPRRSVSQWGPSCVALAQSECGVQCPDDSPLGIGSCSARVVAELDPSCATFDLALGATCEDAGTPMVPVCNHGQSAAPAGLRLTHLPASELGSSAPNLSLGVDCTLSEPIPAGRCVIVSDCPGLTADRAMVVNPIDGSENTDECLLEDNWTVYQPVACRAPVCESGVYDAARVAASDCGVAVQNPLGIDAPKARVTLETPIPQAHCQSDEVRWGSSCYFFSNDVLTWDSAETRCRGRGAGWHLVALNSPAENSWVRGETNAAEDVQIGLNDKATEADHLWSNGTCRGFSNWDLTALQPDNFPPGSEQCVRMTVVSGERWEDEACNDDAHPYVCEGPVLDARGGCQSGQIAGPDGSCYAFDPTLVSFGVASDTCAALGIGWRLVVIDDENKNDFVTGLLDCTSTWLDNPPGAYNHFAPSESVDLSNAPYIDSLGFWHSSIDATPRATLCQGPAAASTTPTLQQVANLGACATDTQYYFEGSLAAPETLKLCPGTCSVAASLAGRHLDVEIPCAPPPPPALETTKAEMYYAADCGDGAVQWDFFYYDAITPADSRIEFEIRTAASEADLVADTVPFIAMAQAHAAPSDTQRCLVGDPGCPIDIFSLLGNPAQQQQELELRVHFIPGTNGEGPLLRDWTVRYSCPPSQ